MKKLILIAIVLFFAVTGTVFSQGSHINATSVTATTVTATNIIATSVTADISTDTVIVGDTLFATQIGATNFTATGDVNVATLVSSVSINAGDSLKIGSDWYNAKTDFKPYTAYTALITQAITSTTSGTLVAGTTYRINSILGSDDFDNVGYLTPGANFIAGDVYSSGTIETGKSYTITDYQSGDDFINVGATSNQTGETFTATGTTPTTWTNSSVLRDNTTTPVTPTTWTSSTVVVNIDATIPAATVLENTLSGAIVWSYTSAGVYVGTLTGEFLAAKTFFHINDNLAPDAGKIYIKRTSDNAITLYTDITDGTATDDLMTGVSLEVRIYP